MATQYHRPVLRRRASTRLPILPLTILPLITSQNCANCPMTASPQRFTIHGHPPGRRRNHWFCKNYQLFRKNGVAVLRRCRLCVLDSAAASCPAPATITRPDDAVEERRRVRQQKQDSPSLSQNYIQMYWIRARDVRRSQTTRPRLARCSKRSRYTCF